MYYNDTRDSELKKDIFTTRTGHGVSFALELIDKEKTFFHNYDAQACFAPMRNCFHGIKQPVAVYSSLHCDDEVQNEVVPFWNFIFDAKISPWRCLLKKGDRFAWTASHGKEKATPESKHDYRGPRSKTPNYCTVPVYADHTNAQALVSLLMASRLGHDSPGSVRLFGNLVKDGVPPLDAFYTCLYTRLHEGRSKELEYIGGAWYAFASDQNNEYKWFRDSTPNVEKRATWGMDYGFLQGIWYQGNRAAPVLNTRFRQLMGGRQSEYKGSFAKLYKSKMGTLAQMSKSVPKYDELVKKIKEVFVELGK